MKKLSKNDQFKEDYIRFMKHIIAKGYARKSKTKAASGKTWYLLHHGVYHPNKPGKIRVVFHLVQITRKDVLIESCYLDQTLQTKWLESY